ncbi:small ribosomal subunit protein bS6m [Lepeophtheirus salmonis]|uniref:Small ribosomal subunit protein bS6m n=1 Tax=Lepeophtheirus salmonis TaxID=72036 RepID=C1BV57_LEPSM|nr:probable 28S ribosomal protein S6, mitochondrial [Lepeophtheirus salmonis]ACO12910.1 Probable mitochondrial 28S ribosomal protein S6 [Lepeophtheirus salmonis]ADD38347.1 Probable 28S ribosomal protein S6, mitochondrial [Lepeophtheirus salmonis]
MPTYELNLVLRKMARPETVSALQRAASLILNEGYIRKMESLGERKFPQMTELKGERLSEGTYFLMKVDLPVNRLETILSELTLDGDFIRKKFVGVKEKKSPVCTLEEELLPPSYRPSVQEMINSGRQRPKFSKEFKSHTGLGYYPFHR